MPAPRRGGASWHTIALVLAALLAFLVALLALAPAGAVKLALAHGDAPVRLVHPEGRLWSGAGALYLRDVDLGRLRWRLTPAALLTGRLGAALSLEASGHHLEGRAALGARTLTLSALQGVVRETTIDRVLNPYAIDVGGELRIRQGALRARGTRVVAARGIGHWSGGRVRYRLGGELYTQTLPPLTGTLSERDGRPMLEVTDESGRALLDVTLVREGWAKLRVRYRFVALAGFPWPSHPAPETVVLELEEKLF